MLKSAEETTQNPANIAIINLDLLDKSLLKTGKTESAELNQIIVNRWSVDEIVALFELPFSDLMHKAQTVHRENFDPNAVQVST